MIELQAGALGNAIRQARLEKHLSQEELSEMVGITATHLKHIESEHRNPSIGILYRLVKILNISLDDIFFPSSNGNELYRQAERLLHKCNEKQIKIMLAVLESLLSFDE